MQPKSQHDGRRAWYRRLSCVVFFCLAPSEAWAIGKVGVGSGLPYELRCSASGLSSIWESTLLHWVGLEWATTKLPGQSA